MNNTVQVERQWHVLHEVTRSSGNEKVQ